jgi:hypothetical protein
MAVCTGIDSNFHRHNVISVRQTNSHSDAAVRVGSCHCSNNPFYFAGGRSINGQDSVAEFYKWVDNIRLALR